MAIARNRKTVAGRPARRRKAPLPTQAGGANRVDLTISRPPLQFRWAAAISEEEWGLYRRAIEALRKSDLRFMLGGGFGLAAYTGRWRDTKDIDFYIHPADRDVAVAALTRAGSPARPGGSRPSVPDPRPAGRGPDDDRTPRFG